MIEELKKINYHTVNSCRNCIHRKELSSRIICTHLKTDKYIGITVDDTSICNFYAFSQEEV